MDKVVALLDAPLNAASAHAEFLVSHGHHGAVAGFTGVKPDGDGAYEITRPSEAALQAVADAVADRFDVAALSILHRSGEVTAGEAVMFVAAAAARHRDALAAVDDMIARLGGQ